MVISHQLNGSSASLAGPPRKMVVEVGVLSDDNEVELSVIAVAGLAGSSIKIHVTASRHRKIKIILDNFLYMTNLKDTLFNWYFQCIERLI
jgi:hypothetical protein